MGGHSSGDVVHRFASFENATESFYDFIKTCFLHVKNRIRTVITYFVVFQKKNLQFTVAPLMRGEERPLFHRPFHSSIYHILLREVL